MDRTVVRIPTKCPMCGQESLIRFSLDTMLQSLAADQPIKLHANCAHHRMVWVASEMERRQIRDYTERTLRPFVTKLGRQVVIT